jgi:FlaA1/EpsC-like NDP-sugar epimerase
VVRAVVLVLAPESAGWSATHHQRLYQLFQVWCMHPRAPNTQQEYMFESLLKRATALTFDVVAVIVAWLLAYALRYNLQTPSDALNDAIQNLPWVVFAQASVFMAFGLYQGIWRFASIPDLRRMLVAIGVGTAVIVAILFVLDPEHPIPGGVYLLYPGLLTLFMAGGRLAYRIGKENVSLVAVHDERSPVLLLGAGQASISLIREFERANNWRLVGMLDDEPGKLGKLIYGVRVLGTCDDLPNVARAVGARHAVLAMPSAGASTRQKLVRLCESAHVQLMVPPSIEDVLSGRVQVTQIRKFRLEDLLGRQPVTLDDDGLSNMLGGHVVMVTGAGGSIGSELCHQIARYRPSLLVLFENSEYSLYQIEQQLLQDDPELPVAAMIGDVKDRHRIDEVLATYRPSVIFHAAAYKHVPMLEHGNAWQAVNNNLGGSLCVAEAAVKHQVEKFVLVSTDKAVKPANVMGATKRAAEMVMQGLPPGRTAFIVVRFGNVLGSNGSVVPSFQDQIARGGPVLVTHPEVTRFFMTIPEAAQLVLQAALMGTHKDIFVLDMGEPVKIADLARTMIRLSGLDEHDVKIRYTGLRPGEKLTEELLADGEESGPTPHPKIRKATARAVPIEWPESVKAWLAQKRTRSEEEVKTFLQDSVPEYHPAIIHHQHDTRLAEDEEAEPVQRRAKRLRVV